MKQQCYLSSVWVSWIAALALAVVIGMRRGWIAAGVVLAVLLAAQLAYLRWFPRVSSLLGYGSVADADPASVPPFAAPKTVTLYTASVCPFCPIVRRRLSVLQRAIGFEFEEVDVTFRPGLVRAKGFRSVPIIEADGRYWAGNETSAQLAEFLSGGGRTLGAGLHIPDTCARPRR